MKIKCFIVFALAFLISISNTKGQNADNQTIKNDIVIMKKITVVQDTILSTYPVLVSVDEKVVLPPPQSQRTIANKKVSVHPVPEKGVIYLKLDNVSKEFEPTLELYDSNGSILRSIPVRSNISTINLEHVPAGKYSVTIDFVEQRFSWEIIKE